MKHRTNFEVFRCISTRHEFTTRVGRGIVKGAYKQQQQQEEEVLSSVSDEHRWRRSGTQRGGSRMSGSHPRLLVRKRRRETATHFPGKHGLLQQGTFPRRAHLLKGAWRGFFQARLLSALPICSRWVSKTRFRVFSTPLKWLIKHQWWTREAAFSFMAAALLKILSDYFLSRRWGSWQLAHLY